MRKLGRSIPAWAPRNLVNIGAPAVRDSAQQDGRDDRPASGPCLRMAARPQPTAADTDAAPDRASSIHMLPLR